MSWILPVQGRGWKHDRTTPRRRTVLVTARQQGWTAEAGQRAAPGLDESSRRRSQHGEDNLESGHDSATAVRPQTEES
jgi:hypothetical protein